MAAAKIYVKDRDDGHIDMQIELSPEPDNSSVAHRLVARFIEFVNAPDPEIIGAVEPSPSASEGANDELVNQS